MAPLFAHYGVKLWLPEAGGPVGNGEDHEQLMLALGLQSKREVTRTRIRVRTAMATQTREQGLYLGGRPPYGYRLADAGPHPNKAHAAWGPPGAHRAREPDVHPRRYQPCNAGSTRRLARIAERGRPAAAADAVRGGDARRGPGDLRRVLRR